VTRGQLPQRAGSPDLNGGGAAAAVPPIKAEKSSRRTSQTQSHNPREHFAVWHDV